MACLVSALRIENAMPFKKMLLFTRDEKSDLGFVFGELLSFFMKKNVPVIVINLAQSFNHYCHVLTKFGVNMKALTESGHIVSIDFLKLAGCLFHPRGDEVPEDCSSLIPIFSRESCKTDCLQAFYASIKQAVEQLSVQHKGQAESFVLFIDELNILLNLGITHAALELFIHYCYSLCYINPEFRGSLLIGAQDDPQDPECHRLLTYFAHKAHARVQVQGLPTGYSDDIHGKIIIKNESQNDDGIQNMLFKVEDKGAKLFPLRL